MLTGYLSASWPWLLVASIADKVRAHCGRSISPPFHLKQVLTAVLLVASVKLLLMYSCLLVYNWIKGCVRSHDPSSTAKDAPLTTICHSAHTGAFPGFRGKPFTTATLSNVISVALRAQPATDKYTLTSWWTGSASDGTEIRNAKQPLPSSHGHRLASDRSTRPVKHTAPSLSRERHLIQPKPQRFTLPSVSR